MSDLKTYIDKRKKLDPEFWKDYDERFETFKLGILLKQARKEAGMTQEQIAIELETNQVSNFQNGKSCH